MTLASATQKGVNKNTVSVGVDSPIATEAFSSLSPLFPPFFQKRGRLSCDCVRPAGGNAFCETEGGEREREGSKKVAPTSSIALLQLSPAGTFFFNIHLLIKMLAGR